jgi:hypothetical protein
MNADKTIVVVCGMVLAGSAFAAAPGVPELSKLPPNTWTVLHTGKAMTRVHPRMVWLPQQQKGFMWLNLDYHTRAITFEDHARSQFFSPGAGTWQARPALFGKEARIHPSVVAQSCVYLPGVDKVLLLMPGHSSRAEDTPATWLFDPRNDTWEPIADTPGMAEDPTTFGAAGSQAGLPVPLLGTLVYDGHNQEVVLVGGGLTWGRVGRKAEKVASGDWIFDERVKRIRRLTSEDSDIRSARKWYPSQCGTWVFSEKTLRWSPIEQPLGEQPPGRILTAAAYVPGEKKIVLFGGDDYSKCLRDTWIYDCTRRAWQRTEPSAVPPPPRAFAGMTAVPGERAVLLAGGYGPGWQPLQDTWTYDLARRAWRRLKADLPAPAACCSADQDAKSGTIFVSWSDSVHRSKTAGVCAGRFDLSSAATVAGPNKDRPGGEYHCKAARDWYVPLPDEWHSEKNKGRDPDLTRRELASLPANTWVYLDAPMKARARQWGSYTYDARTHTTYAWGGGHYGYVGNEVDEFNVLSGRWRSQLDPTAYKARWWHGAGGGGGTAGVGFQGWRLMGIHARKSYAVDVLSNSLLTVHGDVYSLKHHRIIDNIGRCPGGYGLAQQECFLNTPHGLYAFGRSREFGPVLHRALVKEGKWELIARGGDPGYNERNHVCYDSKRDRIIYFDGKTAAVWTFAFKEKKWSREEPASGKPSQALGDSCYIPELDAALLIFATERRGPETLYLYKLDEKKWYTSPYRGKALFSNSTGRDSSPFYDPELKLVVRVAHTDRNGWAEVLVMRLDAERLELTAVK